MASRSTIRSWLIQHLGTSSDDPAYTSTILNDLLEQARKALVSSIHAAAPGYLSKTASLTGSSNTYDLTSQASDFAKVLELRLTNATGAELTEHRVEVINRSKGNFYAITGEDAAATIYTALNLTANSALYLRYAYWPAEWISDAAAPAGVPAGFHDLVALEAAVLAYGLGGEQKLPDELAARWKSRRDALIAHVQMRAAKPTAAATVLDRAGIRSALRGLLGVGEAEKIADEVLNLAILQAEQSLVAAIRTVAPQYISKAIILTGTFNGYDLTSQAADFAKVLEVRLTSSTGVELTEVRMQSLHRAKGNYYAVTGLDAIAMIYTSSTLAADADLFFRYAYTPVLMATDTDTPTSIPAQFRDVVALEAVPLVAGGKHPHADRWNERRAALLEHVQRRSAKPSAAVSVLDRAGIRSALRGLLGVGEAEKITDETLNLAILQAEQALNAEIEAAAPDAFHTTVTLEADSATGHVYTFSTQDTPVTDFAGWLEVRWSDENGSLLREARSEELRDAGVDYFRITGRDDTVVLTTSEDSTAGEDIFLRYRKWPTLMAVDTDVPAMVPPMFRDVVALEAVSLVMGGKQPHDARWIDRKARLYAHFGRRGVQNSRTRLDPTEDPL